MDVMIAVLRLRAKAATDVATADGAGARFLSPHDFDVLIVSGDGACETLPRLRAPAGADAAELALRRVRRLLGA